MADDGTLSLAASQRAPVAEAVPGPGQRVGRFVIRSRLGEGGMGVVLAGHDPDLDRPVAIKLLRAGADAPAYRARLLREAQALARLNHPNVVKVYDVGVDGERVFVAMELVRGTTLTHWVSARRRSWREVVAKFVAVGDGLAAVHRAGLIHRDFKPDNVLVDDSGRARVADFGLARLTATEAAPTDDAMAARLTRTGAVMGTPGYMAPEQQWGSDVDARADQYSFCVGLRAALTGSTLTTASTVSERDDPAAAEREVAAREWARLPRGVRAVITRGLSYDAAERYPDMPALLAALRDTLGSRRARIAAVVASSVFATGVVATSIAIAMRAPAASAPAVAAVTADAAPAADAPGRALASGERLLGVSGEGAVDASTAVNDVRVGGGTPRPRAVTGSAGSVPAGSPPVAGPVAARDAAPAAADDPLPEPDVAIAAMPVRALRAGDSQKNPRHPEGALREAPPLVPRADAPDAYVGPGPITDARRAALVAAAAAAGMQSLDTDAVRADPAGVERSVRDAIAKLEKVRAADAYDLDAPRMALAMIRRFRGDCDEAATIAASLVKALRKSNAIADTSGWTRDRELWYARAHFLNALCWLTDAELRKDPAKAIRQAKGWIGEANAVMWMASGNDHERAEIQMILGILAHEDGAETGPAWLDLAEEQGTQRMRRLVDGYRRAAGL